MGKPFTMRAVQLDLARQMEPLAFIKEFIDFIAEYHYNTLFLYLEWRVRTPSFDIGADNGYSADEISEIADYAAARGIGLIPGIATLSHAEHILRQPEFAFLDELRDGNGRIGGCHDFCPSLSETRKILKDYIADICKIFKGPWIHVGGDETWNMGSCRLCREKIHTFADEENLYLEHYKYIAEVVKQCGKRPLIWDDMFEYYPDILPEFPREYIMTGWQYQDNACRFQGHFCNLPFGEQFALYDRYGFDYLIGPNDNFWKNISSMTLYGRRYSPMGGLLTSWEKMGGLLYKTYPNIAAAGLLWSDPEKSPETAMHDAVSSLFGISDPAFIAAVTDFSITVHRHPVVSGEPLNTHPFFGPDNGHLAALSMADAILDSYVGRIAGTRAKAVYDNIRLELKHCILCEQSRAFCWKRFNKMDNEQPDALSERIGSTMRQYADFIRLHRGKYYRPGLEKLAAKWQETLYNITEIGKSKGILRCLFALPDGYGAQQTRIFVRSADGKTIEVANGCFKNGHNAFFEYCFPLPPDFEAASVEIESHGFGGHGVCYVSAETSAGTFVPAGVTAAEGCVEHPEFMLEPNVNYCWFGFRDITAEFRDRAKSTMQNKIEITMKKQED